MSGEGSQSASFGVIRAQRIEITAADGSTRIELGTSELGDAELQLRDAAGTVRAVVSVEDDTPRVRLLDRSGQVRLSGILRDDGPRIEFLGSEGEPRLVLLLQPHEDEGPDIYFVDHDGDPRFGVAMDYNGAITLAAKDEAGKLKDLIRGGPLGEDEAQRLL